MHAKHTVEQLKDRISNVFPVDHFCLTFSLFYSHVRFSWYKYVSTVRFNGGYAAHANLGKVIYCNIILRDRTRYASHNGACQQIQLVQCIRVDCTSPHGINFVCVASAYQVYGCVCCSLWNAIHDWNYSGQVPSSLECKSKSKLTTVGYHRLWSHRAYTASYPLQVYLAIVSSSAVLGSILYWSELHRVHHRYTDTSHDPYGMQQGFFNAHIGWLLSPSKSGKSPKVDVSDLKRNKIVQWQYRNFYYLSIATAYGFPALMCGLIDGDWFGGLIFAGALRTCFVQQAQFMLNSVAHYMGSQPFESRHSPRDNWFMVFLTLGDGYHNFHHSFPTDYRGAPGLLKYDPTGFFIYVCSFFSLSSNLQKIRSQEIDKRALQQTVTLAKKQSETLDWGRPVDSLPLYTWDEFTDAVAKGQDLILISGVIYDVGHFIPQHPGGSSLLKGMLGKDCSSQFHGGMYDHSQVARNMLRMMHIAVLEGGQEVEILKENQHES